MRYITLLILIVTTTSLQAQWLPEGSVINDFKMTDINNNIINAHQTTATGAHLVIDFSATWCGNCLNYHNSNVLENYYQAYGPNGTITQDAQVVFYEADFSTDNNDLVGTGTNTIADWTQGVTHPICNEAQPSDVYHNFLVNPGNIGYPSVVVMCPNNKYYKISTSITQVAQLRAVILDNCGSVPLSNSSIQDINFEYDVYPNPSTDNLSIDLKLDNAEQVTYALTNTFGQKIIGTKANKMQAGLNKINIDLHDIASGIYLLKMQIGERSITQKVTVAK